MICSVMANTVRDSKRKHKAWTPNDFMPSSERKRMTDKQMYAQVQAINAMLGGIIIEG